MLQQFSNHAPSSTGTDGPSVGRRRPAGTGPRQLIEFATFTITVSKLTIIFSDLPRVCGINHLSARCSGIAMAGVGENHFVVFIHRESKYQFEHCFYVLFCKTFYFSKHFRLYLLTC